MKPDIVRRYGHNPILTKAEMRLTDWGSFGSGLLKCFMHT